MDTGSQLPLMVPSDALAQTIPVTPAVQPGVPSARIRYGTDQEAPVTQPDPDSDRAAPDDRPDGETEPRRSGSKPGGMPVVLFAGVGVAVVILGGFFGFQRLRQSLHDEAFEAAASVDDARRKEQEKEDLKRKIGERRADLDRMVGRMVQLPGGAFDMGANEDFLNEQPVHRVDVPKFEVDELEVSVAAYQLCVGAGKCTAPGTGPNCNWDKPDRRSHPINCVDWTQADAYCQWAAKRLPTEQEWEYAARAPDSRRFAWGPGDPSNQPCWRRGESDAGPAQGTCAAGELAGDLSAFKLKDMAGNVREWTADVYCPYSRPDCESTSKAIRGGAWSDQEPQAMRAALRNAKPADYKSDTVGFRCVRGTL